MFRGFRSVRVLFAGFRGCGASMFLLSLGQRMLKRLSARLASFLGGGFGCRLPLPFYIEKILSEGAPSRDTAPCENRSGGLGGAGARGGCPTTRPQNELVQGSTAFEP